MINQVSNAKRRGRRHRWRSAACASMVTVAVSACGGGASTGDPDCDFVNSDVKPMIMEQNIERDLGGRTYVAGNIGNTEVGDETTLAVEMVETGPDIELTKTDVPNCGDYEIAGVPVRIRVLETSIEVWPSDGMPIDTGPATTVS